MKKKEILIALVIFISSLSLNYYRADAQHILIDQKISHEQRPQYSFEIKEFPISPEKIIFAMPIKIIKQSNKIYVLDQKLSRIFVFNENGDLLYTIGQPGQGPGDLEYPQDFFISENKIYVINSVARRIDVFTVDGKFDNRIELENPPNALFSFPNHLLVDDSGKTLYVTYNLNKYLIDSYTINGKYKRHLLKREEPIIIPGKNLGNSSVIQFANKKKAIIHFNYFTGVFTEIWNDGEIKKIFSAYDENHKKAQKKILDSFDKQISNINNVKIEVFELWADSIAVDEKSGDILALLLIEPQKIYIFSGDGFLKQIIPVNNFTDKRLSRIFYSENLYYFITEQNEIITAIRREI